MRPPGRSLLRDQLSAQAGGLVYHEAWPEVDASALELDTTEVVLQVSGKTRGQLVLPSSLVGKADEMLQAALASRLGNKWLHGKR